MQEETILLPNKMWFSLKEACDLKGLNYKTSCNRKSLQPNHGQPENIVGGRKVFSRETLIRWMVMSDRELESTGGNV